MAKICRVKVDTKSSFLGKLSPFLKVLRLKSVSVCPLTVFKNSIGSMKVDLVLTWNK